MIKINHKQWFDLNYLGLLLILIMVIISLMFSLKFSTILILNLLYLTFGMALYKQIQKTKDFDLILNSENQWFVQDNNELLPVELKDYWLHTRRMFIWLKGPKKSISFMVSRSIIGAETFSQLRSRMI